MRLHRSASPSPHERPFARTADSALAPRLVLAMVALLMLGGTLAVRAAIGDTAPRDEVQGADHAPASESILEENAVSLRANLRMADRTRRAAGRAGLSARRDMGGSSAIAVTADVALGGPRGAAPYEAGPTLQAMHRGVHACGVRGPPCPGGLLG